VQTLDANSAARRQKLDAVKQYVRYKHVPVYLRDKIIDYYEYMYTRIQLIDESRVLKDLPPTLKVQLAVVLNRDLIVHMPLFKYIGAQEAAILVLSLRPAVLLPFEVIVREGKGNDSLYFVRTGRLEVLCRKSADSDEVEAQAPNLLANNVRRLFRVPFSRSSTLERFEKQSMQAQARLPVRAMREMRKRGMSISPLARKAIRKSRRNSRDSSRATFMMAAELPDEFHSIGELGSGDSFGEQSFLTRERSSLTVRTLGYCELMTLHYKDFTALLEEYPDLATHVEGYRREQLEKYKAKTRTPSRGRASRASGLSRCSFFNSIRRNSAAMIGTAIRKK
jgi:CRP-like cAMP-binding protein